jgi:predicted Zn-dependent protease
MGVVKKIWRLSDIVLWLTVLICTVSIVIPTGARAITAGREEELGEDFMKIVKKQYRLIDDPLIVGYVEKVGQKIVSMLPTQPFSYHFYVVDEDVYNAFAAPAAHVFINRGLIEAMNGEEDLAGILAHEITHVHCRHISDMIDRSRKIGMVSMAGVMAGLLFGAGGASELAGGLSFGSVAAGQSLSLAYSREDEMQADQIGLKYLDQAGYSGQGLLHILKEIRSRQWFDSKDIPTYLMTHPAVEQRIAYISCWIEEHQTDQSSTGGSASMGKFHQIQTRLRGLYGDKSIALKYFKAEIENHPEDDLAHYGLGLVLGRSGQYQEALDHMRIALKKHATDPHMLREMGKIYFFASHFEEALNLFRSAEVFLEKEPEGEPVWDILMGRSLLGLGRFREAESKLCAIVTQKPQHAEALYYLSESCSKQGKRGESHYYLGRHYAVRQDDSNARFHLNRALDLLGEDSPVRQDVRKRLESL